MNSESLSPGSLLTALLPKVSTSGQSRSPVGGRDFEHTKSPQRSHRSAPPARRLHARCLQGKVPTTALYTHRFSQRDAGCKLKSVLAELTQYGPNRVILLPASVTKTAPRPPPPAKRKTQILHVLDRQHQFPEQADSSLASLRDRRDLEPPITLQGENACSSQGFPTEVRDTCPPSVRHLAAPSNSWVCVCVQMSPGTQQKNKPGVQPSPSLCRNLA